MLDTSLRSTDRAPLTIQTRTLPLEQSVEPSFSPGPGLTLDMPLGLRRPEEIASEALMAGSIVTIGYENALARVSHDWTLRTALMVEQLILMGYQEQVPTGLDLEVLKRRTESGVPTSRAFVREWSDGDRTQRAYVMVFEPRENGGRKGSVPWRAYVSPAGEVAMSDVNRASDVIDGEIARRMERMGLLLSLSQHDPEPGSLERCILKSARSYSTALDLARFDPIFMARVVDALMPSVSEAAEEAAPTQAHQAA